MSSPLSNEQKAEIAQLARKAYDAWNGREAFEDANPELSRSKCFEAWRRVQQGEAVGIQSLTLCTQDQFLPLRVHFKKMIPVSIPSAMRDALRAQEEPRIRARYKLQQALDERGLNESYAAAICLRQFKCELGQASEKQLWCLFFTIRNRRKPQIGRKNARQGRYVKAQLGQLTITPGNPF